jgi:hypothetical protein
MHFGKKIQGIAIDVLYSFKQFFLYWDGCFDKINRMAVINDHHKPIKVKTAPGITCPTKIKLFN